jgi:hypothetical protein
MNSAEGEALLERIEALEADSKQSGQERDLMRQEMSGIRQALEGSRMKADGLHRAYNASAQHVDLLYARKQVNGGAYS